MLMDHVRTSYVSDAGRKLQKFDQMGNSKLSRSGHDEMLLARIATLDQKMKPSLFSFDFKVNQLYNNSILSESNSLFIGGKVESCF